MATCWSARQRSWQINPISSQKKRGAIHIGSLLFSVCHTAIEKQGFKASLLEGGGICVSK